VFIPGRLRPAESVPSHGIDMMLGCCSFLFRSRFRSRLGSVPCSNNDGLFLGGFSQSGFSRFIFPISMNERLLSAVSVFLVLEPLQLTNLSIFYLSYTRQSCAPHRHLRSAKFSPGIKKSVKLGLAPSSSRPVRPLHLINALRSP